MAPLAEKRMFCLVFVGDADRQNRYVENFMRLVDEKPGCCYKGFACQREIMEYMRISTMLVIPSLEGNCPNVVLEAMAVGLPSAGAAIGVIPDLVHYGVTGFLFNPRDEEDIRKKVRSLLDNACIASAVSAESMCMVLSSYRPLSIAQQHVCIYNAVIQERAERK